jgi:AraC family L-rhamnose operon transcriptional activator RhaR/AraC family L-rhamnose operon regulatory protein RhaS
MRDPTFPFVIEKMKLDEYPLHCHDYHELVVVVNGRGRHIVGLERYEIFAGHVFVINEMVPHGFENADELELFNIVYSEDYLIKRFPDLADIPGFQALFYIHPKMIPSLRFSRKLFLPPKNFTEITAQLRKMDEEWKSKSAGYKTQMISSLVAVIVDLSRIYSLGVGFSPEVTAGIARVISHVQNDYQQTVSLRQLASIACTSERTLDRQFKTMMGMTPIEYVNKVRIEQSLPLLRDPGRSISDVAYAAGFLDSNYFTRRFRRYVGMSPRRYQQLLRQ